jgi:dienelactone hydrolase
MDTALKGWTRSTFEAAGLEREVWTKGSGPAVIVVHEVPGITPKVLRFAEEVVGCGFTVAMPSLVGTPGQGMSNGYAVRSLLKVCVAREFVSLATNQTSPVIAWLRALARDVHSRAGGKGVGAVGMCFSGGFALGMMVDEIMVAPVLSQPSLPFPVGKKRAADLNLSPDDAAVIAQRAAEGCEVLGLRFTGDKLVGDRFASLRTLLGDAFIAVELPSSKPSDHSVLTEQRDDESVQRVLQFFRDKLL